MKIIKSIDGDNRIRNYDAGFNNIDKETMMKMNEAPIHFPKSFKTYYLSFIIIIFIIFLRETQLSLQSNFDQLFRFFGGWGSLVVRSLHKCIFALIKSMICTNIWLSHAPQCFKHDFSTGAIASHPKRLANILHVFKARNELLTLFSTPLAYIS